MNALPPLIVARARTLARGVWRPLARTLPTVAGVVLLNFVLLQLVPGDAVDAMVAEAGSASAETTALLRHRFGLDQSSLAQLGDYVGHLLHLSLGYSPRYDMPVLDLILTRLPNTLLLMSLALFVSLAVGIAFGTVMATWARRWPDRVLSSIAFVLYSTPGFWIGLVSIVLFAVHLGWLPSGGDATAGSELAGLARLRDRLQHAVLPACALASFYIAVYARLTRAAMLEVQTQDHVRTARAKGVGPWRLTLRHVLRNALVPVTSVAGTHLGGLLGGAAVAETVFSWPGIGRLTLEAVGAREYRVLLGVLLLSSLLVIVGNLLVDLLHARLDPRTRSA